MFLCITNRKLCREELLSRLPKLAACNEIEKIILREKDLTLQEYERLAKECLKICREYNKPLVVNKFLEAADHLNIPQVQVSSEIMLRYPEKVRKFHTVGVSVHSLTEAAAMQYLGADYLIAGHVYPTDCKKEMPARGLAYLRKICEAVEIPVYGIGGITRKNIKEIMAAGAEGGCMMSGFMN